MRKYFNLLTVLLASAAIAQETGCPCCTANHKAFDFWIGAWEVTDASGEQLGSSVIEKDLDNCILKESWTNVNGIYKGHSTNFYNTGTGQWEQLWIDNSGQCLKLKGKGKDGKMTLSSEPFTGEDGREYVNRITWTLKKDGSVLQLWGVLSGGRLHHVEFEGYYRRISP